MAFRASLLLALALTVSAKPSSYDSEAASIKEVMEGAKRPNLKVHKSKAALATQKAAVSDEFFPNEHQLDQLLMDKANAVSDQLKSLELKEDPTKPKASLGQAKVKVTESQSARAARYFALHGMKKVGHMLGDELTSADEKKTIEDNKAALAKISAKVETSDTSSLDLPDDDDEDASYKAQWAAVDKIKHRAAALR